MKKEYRIQTAMLLDRILKEEILVGFTVWSDGSATIVLGWERSHVNIDADVWEEFNLRYNIYSY